MKCIKKLSDRSMFKKIISTIFFRALLAGLTFLLAIVTSRYLGPAGKGDVSLFVLNLTIVQLVNNFVGGSYIVYLVPRRNFMHLLFLSYGWALVSAVAVPLGLSFFNLLDNGQVIPLMIIAFLFSLFSVNTMVFIGKEEIGKYNIISLLQVAVLLIVFVFSLKLFGIQSVISYINAMYCSTALAFVSSFALIAKYMTRLSLVNIGETFRETIQSGFLIQLASTAQLLSYRLSFYILDHFHIYGRKEVGIYSVAVSVSEALWLISQSVSLVLYGRISNTNDIHYSRKVTVSLIKIVFVATFACTGLLLCFPSSLYEFIFGQGFGEVRDLLFPLSAGIVVFSVGIILSSYFVGNGRPLVCVIGSSIGLVITVVLGFSLIPEYGMMGAAATASVSYCAGVVYQLYKFMREADELRLRDLVFIKNDIEIMRVELKNIFSEKKEL